MSRTLPLVFVYWVVSVFFMKRLYLWARYTNPADTAAALQSGLISEIQAHCLDFKRPMLNPTTYVGVILLCFAIWAFYTWRLNSLGLEARPQVARHHAALDQEARKHQRPGHRGLLAHHDRCGHLLGHVDGRHLVLLGLRPAVPRRPGLLGAGARHHRPRSAFRRPNPSRPSCARPSSTTWASSPSPS